MLREASPRSAAPEARRRRRGAHVHVEALEGRLLLFATNGGEWAHPERVTFSFAPDGTNLGGPINNLNATMAAKGFSSDAWRNAFRDAAALWEQVAGVNLAEVPDMGDPYGVSGNQQNDPRFGDIRIAGAPLGTGGTLGLAFTPPPVNGGTLAGDIVLNTSMPWSLTGNYNLETVAIHELGHALGMDHSGLTSAVMYAYYNSIKSSLTTDDVAGIQSVYGLRPGDAFEGAAGNQTWTTASSLDPYLNASNQISVAGLSIHMLANGGTDQDWYAVTVPSTNNRTMSVTVQSTNLSLLSPRVLIYNASPQLLSQDAAPYAYGATVTASVSGVSAGQTYYIRVVPANGGQTSMGAYGLQVNFTGAWMPPIQPPDTTVLQQANQGGGSSNLSVGGSLGMGSINVGAGLNLNGSSYAGAFASTDGGVKQLADGQIQLGSLLAQGDLLTTRALASVPAHPTFASIATGAGVIGIAPQSHDAPAPQGPAHHFRRHRRG